MAKQITVTKEGLKKLQDELIERKSTRRDEIKEAIRIARGFGDLSENSEYDEALDSQAQNEHRINELEEMLKHVILVDSGKQFRVLNKNTGKEIVYTIVGSTETNPFENKISDQSPVGLALVGKNVGDEAIADTPRGKVTFEILEVM
ncbi:MAG: transcription elongation factor GreA [Clostridia bacterium]|nr:transcription elongation factor GreA [Clostridia bacterium]